MRIFVLWGALLLAGHGWLVTAQSCCSLQITIHTGEMGSLAKWGLTPTPCRGDPNALPGPDPKAASPSRLPDTEVSVELADGVWQYSVMVQGTATVTLPGPGGYTIRATSPGYQTVEKTLEIESNTDLDLTLIPIPTDSITVEASAPQVDSAASSGTTAERKDLIAQAREPATVRDALPLVPGVVRTPEGKLRIMAAPEERSALLVNSHDVTDPATGGFGATVPIDAVEKMTVYKSPFLAEYGRFTSGVVAVETRRGGEKWSFELNDPTPEFRIRSAHLVGIRGFTPRLSVTGPIRPGKLYLSQSIEFLLKKTPVFTLPFPENEERRQSWNVLTQLDYLPSPRHLLSATLHGVPQRVNYAGLDFYNPRPTTPNFRGHEFRGGLAHHYQGTAGLLESAVSGDRTFALIGNYGDNPMILTPTRHLGNYFLRQDREAERWQWRETWTPNGGSRWSSWKIGGAISRTTLEGGWEANPIQILGANGQALSSITFQNQPPYRLRDTEAGVFLQNRVQPHARVTFDAGLRADYQQRSGVWRMAPRIGMAWTPIPEAGTTIRAGAGYFFDRVPLNIYAFPNYPQRTVTNAGMGEPLLFHNVLARPPMERALIFGDSRPGAFAPRSANWMLEWEHRFPRLLLLRGSYLDSQSDGQVILQPRVNGTDGELALTGSGRSRQRHFEIVSRWAFGEQRHIFASYVWSRARSNLNTFSEFLGNYPVPLVRDDFYTEATGNTPHRFLAWGVIPLAKGWQVAPMAEWRSGFPYSAYDPFQEYFGVPNTRRFPAFLSLDMRVAKDVHYRGHAFRISFSMFNLTNRFNPDTVRRNTGDDLFGQFIGRHPRRFRIDFDFLF